MGCCISEMFEKELLMNENPAERAEMLDKDDKISTSELRWVDSGASIVVFEGVQGD